MIIKTTNKLNNKTRTIIFWTLSIIILIVIGIITINVIYQTENPALFDIDFDKKDHIISSYGILVGVLLTFLSIVFIIHNILQQKQQYDNDKREQKIKEKNSLFDRLKLVMNLVNEICSHIEDTGKEMKTFSLAEKNSPLKNNQMYFYTNKNYSRLLELDYHTIFNAFQEFDTEIDKTKSFNNLYYKVDFYSESIAETKEKYQYHIKDKFQRKVKIANELNSVMDDASKMTEEYKCELTENDRYKQNKWYKLLNGLLAFYYERIPEDDEADYEQIDKEVLFVFLKDALKLRESIGFEKKTQDLVLKIAVIRKQLYTLKIESLDFGKQILIHYNEYYSTQSENYKDLCKLKDHIELLINLAAKK
ncbi:hypothetical protein [Lentimicrobium sp. S6]|uniref:hypothetical protein n=1 Tax=Lentimicrobium sp. S6 TaxID=2735872 RepID=UPI0015518CDE|nr:hypothetical protein [Lentimicrobium sp. S6]NPD48024.1 hypothetical protein [Lentimicrobium sp. S6]